MTELACPGRHSVSVKDASRKLPADAPPRRLAYSVNSQQHPSAAYKNLLEICEL